MSRLFNAKSYSLLLPMIICLCHAAMAQTEVDERAVIRFDKGLGFHAPDTSFGLNLRFRMQNRIGFTGMNDRDPLIDEVDARIRRLRLRIDGYTKNQKLTYYLQLSFSRSDQDWDNSGVPNIVRDAMVYYSFSDNFYAGIGQGKLPGNRQRINSSGQLQFADRSGVNARFNIDRDFGIMAYYSDNISGFHYNIKTAVSSGEGRSALASDRGLAYTARLELMPLGPFLNDGDFSEGDLEREPSPRLSLAGGYHYNHRSLKTQGQRGKEFIDPRNLSNLYFDALMKYNGWALYAEYMDRFADNPWVMTPEDGLFRVATGYGVNIQMSYIFRNNIELAGRYTYVEPEKMELPDGIEPPFPAHLTSLSEPNTREYTLGLTRYLIKHKVKAQANLGYRESEHVSPASGKSSAWIVQLQIELGI